MRTRKRGERGMSLIEVVVATAVLLVAILIALTVYDAARSSFKKGENATVQQEAVRIAYDRLTADLRMLGFNVFPDGNAASPDEPLEVALEHAMIFRGDFDAEDAAKKNDQEGLLAGGFFNVVSTGNDEVVGYVLSRPDGTGPDTITFQADVDDEPRDGTVTTVTVNNVVLNPTNPPYTLYKITLNNDVGTCCAGDFIVRTPLVENIRNMSFQYFDATGTAPVAFPATTEVATEKQKRANVTRFNVSLVGMTKDPDMNYTDATDTAAPKYRKFELRGDVVPRNIRMKGIPDLNAVTAPPTKPATPTLIPGHCGALIVVWAPNPTADNVSQYRINYGPSSGVVSGTKSTAGSPYYLSGLTTGSTTYVTIQAQNASGDVSIKSNEASAVVVNSNTPSAPTAASATTDQINNVRLNWTAVTTNTASVPAADPLAPLCRDLAGYRIYRGDTSATGPLLVNESVVKAPGNPPYVDTATVNCHTYYYQLSAVDTCGVESALTSPFSGQATTTIAPNAPTNVQAFKISSSHGRVTWSAVVKDVADNPVTVAGYDVYRSDVMKTWDDPATAVFTTTPIGSPVATSYDDFALPFLNPTETVYYVVKAKDECVNYSAASNLAEPVCPFSGTVTIAPPTDGTIVAGVVPTTVTVVSGTDTYTGVTITYTHESAGVTRTFTSSTAGTTWTDSAWLASPPGVYTITATVTNSTGCQSTTSITVTAGSAVGCCLSIYPTTTTTATCAGGSTKCKEVSYRIGNDRCLTSASILSLRVRWIDYSGNQPRWQTAKFNGTTIAAVGSWSTTYVTVPPNEVGIAFKNNFSAPSPEVPYASPMTGTNTTVVTYVFDDFTDSGNGVNRKVNVFNINQFMFTLLDSTGTPSGITTTCNMPTLTVN